MYKNHTLKNIIYKESLFKKITHLCKKIHFFKKYKPPEKFTFQQLIENFVDCQRFNSVFMGERTHLKHNSNKINSYFEN